MGIAKRLYARHGLAAEGKAYRICTKCGAKGCDECFLLGHERVTDADLELHAQRNRDEILSRGLATPKELDGQAEDAGPKKSQGTFGWN